MNVIFCDVICLFIVFNLSNPNLIEYHLCFIRSNIVLDSAQALWNAVAYRMMTIVSMAQNRLNREWMQTWDVDVEPFNKETFKFSVLKSKLILKQNHSLI